MIELLSHIDEALDVGDSARFVTLVRHAEPISRDVRSAGELLDPPLTDKGRAQAEALAIELSRPLLANAEIRPSVLVSSTLRRSLETAMCIGARLDLAVERERHFDEIRFDIARLQRDRAPLVELQGGQMFGVSGVWDDLPYVEDSNSIRRRGMDAIGRTVTGLGATESAIVVTHGALMNAVLAHCWEVRRDYFLPIRHCGHFTLAVMEGSVRVLSVRS